MSTSGLAVLATCNSHLALLCKLSREEILESRRIATWWAVDELERLPEGAHRGPLPLVQHLAQRCTLATNNRIEGLSKLN